jgi:YVTN family beta-propeller protein
MNSSSRYGAVRMNHIAPMSREYCSQRFSFFAAVILFVAAAIGSPAHAQTVTATVPVGNSPIAIAVNAVTNQIYVANGGGTVTVIDGTTNATTTVTVGAVAVGIAANSVTNKIYVANAGGNSVTVIDGATNTATATVPVGMSPQGIAVNSVTNKIYATNLTDGTVTVIDGTTNATTTVPVGKLPYAIAVNSVTNQIYVVDTGDNNVTVIDGNTNATTTVAVGTYPDYVAVNTVTNKIYVTDLTAGTVTVIDGTTNATTAVTVGMNPQAIGVNTATNLIYVANAGATTVSVIDGATNATTTVAVGAVAVGIAVDPALNKIYVANAGATVTVIDGASNATTAVTETNPNAFGPANNFGPTSIVVNPVTSSVYVCNVGTKSVTVIGAAGGTSTPTPTPTPTPPGGGGGGGGGPNGSARLINISTRAEVGTGANILIPGFVISGSGSEILLIRADGPALTGFGVAGALAQPSLSVFDSAGNVVASNTGWGTNAVPTKVSLAAVSVGAFALAPGSADCAVLANLSPGAYTVQVSGVGNSTGVALAEVYEVSSSGTRLANISTRASVGTGANIIIPGFVISGSGSDQLLARGDGPALTGFGVARALAQPSLSVFDSSGNVIASNAGWGTNANPAQIASAAATVGAFALTSGSADSALIVNVTAGAYTMQLSGVNNSTGVALAEIYEVP